MHARRRPLDGASAVVDLPDEQGKVPADALKTSGRLSGRPDRPLAELLLINGNGEGVREADMVSIDRLRDRSTGGRERFGHARWRGETLPFHARERT